MVFAIRTNINVIIGYAVNIRREAKTLEGKKGVLSGTTTHKRE